MRVYVVYEHNYDHSGNRAVFDTEEKAIEYVKRICSDGQLHECNFEVEHWDVL
jgi:hypothetical protein